MRFSDLATEVACSCAAGHPRVLRCYPLRRTRHGLEPFPTLYWLVCPRIARAVAHLERDGWIARLEERIASDEALQSEIAQDHARYAAERWSALRAADRAEVTAAGLAPALRDRGIGGLRDFTRLKCLHLHAAHHLAVGSTVGKLLAELDVFTCCPPERS